MGQFTSADCNSVGLSVARSEFFSKEIRNLDFLVRLLNLKMSTHNLKNKQTKNIVQIRCGCSQNVIHRFSVYNLCAQGMMGKTPVI